jgi:hypothetical protein
MFNIYKSILYNKQHYNISRSSNVILHIPVYSKWCQKRQFFTFLFRLLFSSQMKNRPNAVTIFLNGEIVADKENGEQV